jgi:hypothetical protein
VPTVAFFRTLGSSTSTSGGVRSDYSFTAATHLRGGVIFVSTLISSLPGAVEFLSMATALLFRGMVVSVFGVEVVIVTFRYCTVQYRLFTFDSLPVLTLYQTVLYSGCRW